MINYYKKLILDMEETKGKLEAEVDNFKKIELQVELRKLDLKIKHFDAQIESMFKEEEMVEIVMAKLTGSSVTQAQLTAASKNKVLLNRIEQLFIAPRRELIKSIDKILSKNPDAEKEENKETQDYKDIKFQRDRIKKIDNLEADAKKDLISFYSTLSPKDKDIALELLVNKIDEDPVKAEKFRNEINNYKPIIDIFSNLEYPLQDTIEEVIKTNENPELVEYLQKNKDEMNRLTVSSNPDSAQSYSDRLVRNVEIELSKIRHQVVREAAKERNIDDLTTNVAMIDSKKAEINIENYNRVKNNIKPFKVDEKVRAGVKRILHLMDALKLTDKFASANESAYKNYGFVNYLLAKQELINAFKEPQLNKEKIQEAVEALKKEEKVIQEVYKEIENHLGNDYTTMPTNVDSVRNAHVPPEFKKDLVIHAKFNSLYLMLSFIKEQGYTIDEFVDNPLALSTRALEKDYNEYNINNLVDHNDKTKALLYIVNPDNRKPILDSRKYGRSCDLLSSSATNPEDIKENEITLMCQSYIDSSLVTASTRQGQLFADNPKETLQNFFLAKKQNGKIDYLDCYVGEKDSEIDPATGVIQDGKKTAIYKVFDDDFETIFYDSLVIVKNYAEAYNKDGMSEKLTLNPDILLESLQELSLKFMLTHNLKNLSEDFVNDLNNIITDYKKITALKDINFTVDNEHVATLTELLNNKKNIIKKAQKDVSDILKNEDIFYKAFTEINKEIDRLEKKADKESKKLGKGETNEAIEEIIILQQEQIKKIEALQNSELNKLREQLKEGKITDYYFEKRSEQVLMLKDIKEKNAMFMCDDKNYKNFDTYLKKVLKLNPKEMTQIQKETEKDKYDKLIQEAKNDKEAFLINRELIYKDISKNVSVNPGKIENIVSHHTIEEFKTLSKELIDQNQKLKEEQKNFEIKNKDESLLIANEPKEQNLSNELNNEIEKQQIYVNLGEDEVAISEEVYEGDKKQLDRNLS